MTEEERRAWLENQWREMLKTMALFLVVSTGTILYAIYQFRDGSFFEVPMLILLALVYIFTGYYYLEYRRFKSEHSLTYEEVKVSG